MNEIKNIKLEETKERLRSIFKNSKIGLMYIPSDYEIEILKKDKSLWRE